MLLGQSSPFSERFPQAYGTRLQAFAPIQPPRALAMSGSDAATVKARLSLGVPLHPEGDECGPVKFWLADLLEPFSSCCSLCYQTMTPPPVL